MLALRRPVVTTCSSASCFPPSRAMVMSSGGPRDARLQGGSSSSGRSTQAPPTRSKGPGRQQLVTLAGNKATGGPFSPLVGVVRNAVGEKDFNKFRGKAISLHSQVIKTFCTQIGADNKQVQGVIRLAKKNGEKLGFLA